MSDCSRREFLKLSGIALARLALLDVPLTTPRRQRDAPPASLGRIANWHWQAVRREPSPTAERVAWCTYDEVIPLYAAVNGEAPWPSNPVWYLTDGGYIHSAFVQPVEDHPQSEVVTGVIPPGFWAQVSVPITEARWRPGGPSVARKLYYSTVYRVVSAETDEEGGWWYRIQEGYSYSAGPYVPAASLRRIPGEELLPLSPGWAEKRIEVVIAEQTLTCFEDDNAVFSTRVSTGVDGLITPRGEHRVLYKRHTQRMTGGSGEAAYDLPGVPFPVYITGRGVAIHGCYWHNDYGQRHSHGCVNVTAEAAQWIFRWVEPLCSYDTVTQYAARGQGTPVRVV